MNDIDIPILKKTYELYSTFHEYRRIVSKADRFTVYERSENLIVDLIELFLEAGYTKSGNKSAILEKASVKLNTLRFFIRLMKETKVFDIKKYTILQEKIDEIGRMLGGWIRSEVSR
ncbi:MAG: hypothetical protein A3G05_02425 [Candidatus Zambryskibacteria bacterium RIFCSPLOWO2_12_FULL_45_14]|uniref:bAvd-like domain-containing protein n=2 Tax=Candidatus Zambryskiibacteriota TaxID=1817925 RepID=A0A1G2UJW2_9BACT|nr:MAG: hypothetical protein A3H60_02385 [Candidatus Zambryskibacteria bacterium RIFCSPLOWO2_02_FULL_44_12b]OHB14565.1 MAG: hypothetical protein A3G05_02425 [Candidatus Zambryskibacteria bacterium RIFCSPLOWO2_12_FULL_45_14]